MKTVSERLVAFIMEWNERGVPDTVLHEALRLLVNQLKASVGATDHPAIRIMHEWALDEGAGNGKAGASMLWFGGQTTPAQACIVNGALFEVLDFNDTYIPTFMHAVSGVLPAVLALAETGNFTGRQMLTALALGIEAELACATILMPTGYFRGFVPGGLSDGIGSAAACSILAGLDAEKMRNAIGLAMCTAFGIYESVGSMALPYIMGTTARSGYTAYQMAARGLDAPATAFEGDKGMLASHSDEPAAKIDGVFATLGQTWRIFGNSYKTVPTETITHAPVECVLEVLGRANGRTVEKMVFGVEKIVVKIADERRERFGIPDSELTARFDLRFCAAAAWVRGHFTLAEMREAAYTDAAILAMRDRIELVGDPARPTFDGCSLEVFYTDGSTDRANVDDFLGTPGRPMSDAQLSDVFRSAAAGLLPEGRADAILDAAWALPGAADTKQLMQLLTLH